jgi:hypothetical protein
MTYQRATHKHPVNIPHIWIPDKLTVTHLFLDLQGTLRFISMFTSPKNQTVYVACHRRQGLSDCFFPAAVTTINISDILNISMQAPWPNHQVLLDKHCNFKQQRTWRSSLHRFRQAPVTSHLIGQSTVNALFSSSSHHIFFHCNDRPRPTPIKSKQNQS